MITEGPEACGRGIVTIREMRETNSTLSTVSILHVTPACGASPTMRKRKNDLIEELPLVQSKCNLASEFAGDLRLQRTLYSNDVPELAGETVKVNCRMNTAP